MIGGLGEAHTPWFTPSPADTPVELSYFGVTLILGSQ
jgi:hypothetical protein